MAEYFVTCLSFSLPVFLSLFFVSVNLGPLAFSLRSHLTFCLLKKRVIRPNPAVPLSPRVPITHPLLLLSTSFHFLPFLLPLLCLRFSFLLSYTIHWSFFFSPQEVTSEDPKKRKPLLWHYVRETSLLIPPPAWILYLSECKKNQNSIKLPSHNSSHKSDEFSTRRVLLTSVSLFPSSRTCIFFWFVSFIRPHLHVSLNY